MSNFQKLELEEGDTIVIAVPANAESSYYNYWMDYFTEYFKKDGIQVIMIHDTIKLNVLKTSKLELKNTHPALKDAWEKFQEVKKLVQCKEDEDE